MPAQRSQCSAVVVLCKVRSKSTLISNVHRATKDRGMRIAGWRPTENRATCATHTRLLFASLRKVPFGRTLKTVLFSSVMLRFIRFYRSDFSTFPQAKTPPKQHQTTDSLTPVLSAPKPDPARDDGGHTGQPEGRAVVHPQEGAVHRLVDLSDLQQGD